MYYISVGLEGLKHCSGRSFLALKYSFKSSVSEMCCALSFLLPALSSFASKFKVPSMCPCCHQLAALW